MRALHLLSAFVLGFGAMACSEDPIADESNDDTGDTEAGDGDGDADPDETIILDMYLQTCGPTASWTSVTVGLMPIVIPCDMIGLEANGWTARYLHLLVGEVELDKVISLVPGLPIGQQIRGTYDLAAVADPHTLEFRSEVLLKCDDPNDDCVGRFALASAEGIDGALTEIEDRELSSDMQIEITIPLSELQSLSEPSVVLIAERTEPGNGSSPEVLLIKPRLVQP